MSLEIRKSLFGMSHTVLGIERFMQGKAVGDLESDQKLPVLKREPEKPLAP